MAKVLYQPIKYIIFFLAFALLFVYTITPGSAIQDMSLWNLLLLGTIGSVVLVASTNKQAVEWFRLKSTSQFFSHFTIGIILGVVVTFAVSYLITGLSMLYNVLGAIPYSTLASMGTGDFLFTVIIQPMTETLLIVSGVLFLAAALKKYKIPQHKVIAIILIMVVFAAFHFTTRGAQYYDSSLTGFINFIGDTEGWGTAAYHGAFPQFLLGIFWAILALGYQSYIVPFAAHLANNLLAVMFAIQAVAAGNEVMIFANAIALAAIVIVAVVVYKTQLKGLNEFRAKAVFGSA